MVSTIIKVIMNMESIHRNTENVYTHSHTRIYTQTHMNTHTYLFLLAKFLLSLHVSEILKIDSTSVVLILSVPAYYLGTLPQVLSLTQ